MIAQTENTRDALIIELAKEEAEVAEADRKLQLARMEFDLATRRYAAVRDYVTGRLGSSPYLVTVKWPEPYTKHTAYRGRYRFVHMEPGDAAIAALKETDTSMSLEEIVARVLNGGLRMEGVPVSRVINAALMRTSGIEKTEDGKYTYKELSPDDIPF
jgi:hypothetical protein